jgi:hypothetical protein
MDDNLKLSKEPLTGGVYCKNCIHALLKGNPKHGAGFYKYFCTFSENLLDSENFEEGVKTIYAQPGQTCNEEGSCADYEAISP